VLPKTSLGTLDISLASDEAATLSDRPHLPARPANCKVESEGFATVNLGGLSTATATWANRNRLTETGTVLAWDGATQTVESSQTTTIKLTDDSHNVVHSYTGLTGVSTTITLSHFGGIPSGYVEFYAVRDGLESLQAHAIRVALGGFLQMTTGDYLLQTDNSSKIILD